MTGLKTPLRENLHYHTVSKKLDIQSKHLSYDFYPLKFASIKTLEETEQKFLHCVKQKTHWCTYYCVIALPLSCMPKFPYSQDPWGIYFILGGAGREAGMFYQDMTTVSPSPLSSTVKGLGRVGVHIWSVRLVPPLWGSAALLPPTAVDSASSLITPQHKLIAANTL